MISSPASAFSMSLAPTLATQGGLDSALPHLLFRLALLSPLWSVKSGIFPFRLRTKDLSACQYLFSAITADAIHTGACF